MTSIEHIIEYIQLKINKLDSIIESLEEYNNQGNADKRAAYIAEGNSKKILVAKWLRQFIAPNVILPSWRQDQSRIEFQKLLKSEDIKLKELAAQLNLYTLNTAIKLAQLKAEKSLVEEAEELRQIAEKIHKMSNSGQSH